ncbi:MAG: hypothetical protein KDJ27_07565 [Gammaproteobacteria bacterium]|nr:hypothetical protein [Caldilineaceae bacterium]MCB1923593.1 hypothetical protein [Gammaproteobacteria bacterium]
MNARDRNTFQPTRTGAKHQINQLLSVLNTEQMTTGAQIKIGGAVAFLQEVQRTLPAFRELRKPT